MQVDYVGGLFTVRCTFDERTQVRDAGFDWHPDLRRWVTTDPKVALRFQDKLTAGALRYCRAPDALVRPDGVHPTTGLPLAYLPFQEEGIRFAMQRKDTLIADEPGLGKGHPITTTVATPKGWRAIGDLKIGDEVIGSAGAPIIVTGIFDRGILPVYTVRTDDGAQVTVDGDHLWLIYHPEIDHWATLTTLQVAALARRGENPIIPVLGGPVQFLEKDYPVPPRVAGIDAVNRRAYGELLAFDCRAYQTGSIAQRVAFLTAVVRTMGRVRAGKIRVDIKAPHHRADLVDTIIQITRSLGGLAYKEERFRRARLTLHLPDPIWINVVGYSKLGLRINRRWRDFEPGVPHRRIVEVRPAGMDQVRCISVHAHDRLYVTEDYIVTHNTVQAIGVGNQIPNLESMLVVSLASHKEMWQRAIELWDVHGLSVDIAYGNHFPDSQAVVINYDILDRHYDAIRAGRWGLVVCDEAHALMTEGTKRTSNVLGGDIMVKMFPDNPKSKRRKKKLLSAIPAERRVLLSGTPMPSRPKNIWPIASAFDPYDLGAPGVNIDGTQMPAKLKFAYRYCGAYETGMGLDDTGSSNLDELHKKLIDSFMIRRLKEDVLKELPPKSRLVIPLQSEGLSRKIAAEHDAIQEVLRQYEMKHGMINPDPEDLADYILSAPPKLFDDYARTADGDLDPDTPLNQLAIARQELALAKIPMIVEHVEALLQSEKKVIVFAYHQAVVEALTKTFGKYDPAVIYGKTPSKKRQAQEDKFQQQDSCRVFIGNYTAAGTGFTLTAGRVVVCAELTWLPHELSQAEDRAHRLGQLDNVLVHHLIVEGSLDDALIVRIFRKQVVIARAIDGKKIAA